MLNKANQTSFHTELKRLMDQLAHLVYDVTLHFPREEQFGITSQMRRAVLSIILNYIEGYARQRKNVLKNFLEISYGSLKELKYLLYFSYKRKLMNQGEYDSCLLLTDRIGKMLWGTLSKF